MVAITGLPRVDIRTYAYVYAAIFGCLSRPVTKPQRPKGTPFPMCVYTTGNISCAAYNGACFISKQSKYYSVL